MFVSALSGQSPSNVGEGDISFPLSPVLRPSNVAEKDMSPSLQGELSLPGVSGTEAKYSL